MQLGHLLFVELLDLGGALVEGTLALVESALSKARILRPCRPMMRPFISSLGSGTAETTVSETWSEAMR